jgi:amino acid adenylation domain-containing protein
VNLAQFVDDLERRRVRLSVEDGRLRCTAPKGVLDEELLDRIRARRGEILGYLHARGSAKRTVIPATDRTGPLPLSHAQVGVWLSHQLDPDDTSHNLPLELHMTGRLSAEALRQALSRLVERHEPLRTVYPVRRGEPSQVVIAHTPCPLPLVDLTGLPPAARKAVAREIADAEARLPFDLAQGPVVRTTLVRCSPTEHRLLVTRHHISSDGWSFSVIAEELDESYRSALEGAPWKSGALPVQYGDFARWQHGQAATTAHQEGLERWARRLKGASTELGLAVPRDRDECAEAGIIREVLEDSTSQRVDSTARELRTTPFTVLLTAFGLVLASAAHRDEIVIGTPTMGRPYPELAPLIGCFATMVPLRLPFTGVETFADAVRGAHQVVAEALSDQHVAPEQPGTRLGSRSFEAVFTYQNMPVPSLALPGLVVQVEDSPAVAPKFPLTFTITEDGDRRKLLVEFDRGLIEHATAQALTARFTRVLASATESTRRRCAELVRRAAHADLPSHGDFHVPLRPVSPRETLASRFVAMAIDHRESVAVTDGTEHLTYGALYKRAWSLAARLRAVGVGPDDPVAICAEPSADLVIAMVAVTLSGAAYLPLDPGDPPARHEVTLSDAKAGVLIVDSRSADLFPWYEGVTLTIPRRRAVEHPEARSGTAAAAENLAYVIYTSGTTGTPKGVMITHRGATELFTATEEIFGFTAGDVWSCAHSSAFDFSVWEIWGALLHGARVLVIDRRTVRDPSALWRTVRDEQVTVLSSTPGAYQRLVPADAESARGSALRAMVLGGERCDPRGLPAWPSGAGHERPRLVNMYGITECTVHVTSHVLPAEMTADMAASPLGRALPGARAFVVDRARAPVPVGGKGELLVGGFGLARGYLGRPGLTADRFRPDDMTGARGDRLYSTGDSVRLLTDGTLDYLGRLDSQISLRGHRIEPGEIEAALVAHPHLTAAAVAARPVADRMSLIAYVVAPGTVPPRRDLRGFLTGLLPHYMIPDTFVVLDRLPVTRNGKVDRAALPEPDQAVLISSATEPAQGPTERTLAAIWCELLHLESVGRHDDFFALGGDSLLATRMQARLSDAFGIDIPMRRVYRALDIASLAEAVNDLRARAGAEETC